MTMWQTEEAGGVAAAAPCASESESYGPLTTGDATYAFAGIETERTPADLLQVADSDTGIVYAETAEQPFPELFIDSDDGLLRFVLLNDKGLPEDVPEEFATTLPNGTPVELRFAGPDTEVDADSLVRINCIGGFPVYMPAGVVFGAVEAVHIGIGGELLRFEVISGGS